jgi:putative ABC transport system permease protein
MQEIREKNDSGSYRCSDPIRRANKRPENNTHPNRGITSYRRSNHLYPHNDLAYITRNPLPMLKSYFTVAFRFLNRHRAFAFINIFGLAVGASCALCIFLFVSHELSYDTHYPNADRIYRVIQGGDEGEQSSSLPFPSGPTLLHDYPEMIEKQVRLFNFQASSLAVVQESGTERKAFNETRFFFGDSTFFEVFKFSVVAGDPANALNGPGLVVINRSTAMRYFNSTDAVGKVFGFEGKYDLTVTAVVDDVPENTHFRFDFLASFASLQNLFEKGIPETNWYWNPVWTYVMLKPGQRAADLEKQLPFFVQKYYHPSVKDETQLVLQPVTDIYLTSKSSYEIGAMSDMRYVYIFSIVSLVVLLMACINFINLTTAHAAERFKEIGMRKVMGAQRRNLIFQFISESMMMVTLAAVIAIAITAVVLPYLNVLTGKSLNLFTIVQPEYLLRFATAILATGLLAGSYPAFVLSRHQAVDVLKPNQGKYSGNILLRKALVVVQFTIAVVFISGSILAFRQIGYMQNARLGFEGDQILVLPVQRLSIVPQYESFKKMLQSNSNVINVSTANVIVGREYQSSNYKREGADDMTMYPCLFVRNDFAKTMGIPMVAGRDFSEEMTTPGYQAMINRSLALQLGWNTPEEAVGQILDGTLEGKIEITGVTEDFHYASLKEVVGPMIMLRSDMVPKHRDFFTRFVLVRVKGSDLDATVDFARKKWNDLVSESPFDYFFLDDNLDRLYKAEEKFNELGFVFSIIAISIGALGLFGLAAFAVRKRRKEISIRRVLGASVRSILVLLSQDFILLIAISSVLGIPLCWYLMSQWLRGFAFRIEIGPAAFIAGVFALLAMTALTIGFTTARASRANPVDSLRSE